MSALSSSPSRWPRCARDDGGVVLVAECGVSVSTATTVWPAELAGLPVARDHPAEPVAAASWALS